VKGGSGLGVNTRRTDGNFRNLAQQLDYLQEAGFDTLEVSVDVVDTIAGGRLVAKRMDRLQGLLDRYRFRRTAHIHNGVDLRDVQDRAFQIASFLSGIDFAARIGAGVLVFHFEQRSEDPAREALFREAVMIGLEHAARGGVRLALENIEVEPLGTVVDFVRALGMPELLLAVDVGHAFLSEPYFGRDFCQSVAEAAPLAGHIHLSDNFGRFEPMRLENFDLYRVSSYTNRLNRGTGDLNLPPGWGSVPFEQVLPLFRGFQGVVVLEYYHDKYLDFNAEIAAQARELLARHLGP